MRKLMILMMVAALVVALAAGTAAAKQNGKNKATYNFEGTVLVAEDGSYLEVDVTDGNKRARAYVGEQLQFGVTEDTKVEINNEDAALSDLADGDEVRVQSKAPQDATEFMARKVSVETDED